MPDKNYKTGCGKECVRCWRNKLKHANPETKKFLKKSQHTLGMENETHCVQNYVENEERPRKRRRAFQLKSKLIKKEDDVSDNESCPTTSAVGDHSSLQTAL